MLLAYVGSGMAATYKWIDKDGHVHFSQTPPMKQDQAQSSAKLDERIGASVITAIKNGDKIYCGRLHVINIAVEDTDLEQKLKTSLDEWTQQRERLDKERKTDVTLNEQYAEYDCRVRWAYQQLKTLQSFEHKSNKAYKTLQKEYNTLKARQDEECSTDPKKLGKTMLVGKEANEWGKCYNHYRYKMRDLKAKMKENRKSLREAR